MYMQGGETPLMSACSRGHQKVAELLLGANANVNVQTEVRLSDLELNTLIYCLTDIVHR